MQDSNWVEVHTFPGPTFAEMAKEALQNEGIPSYIKKDFMSSTYSSLGTGLPGTTAKLLVPEDLVEKSKAILDQIFDSDA